MSKGLEALEKLKGTLLADGYWQDVLQDCSIIETELNDYYQLQEDYENLKESYNTQCFNKDTIDNLRTLCDKLQKVLGIIKSKYVDLWLLSHFKSWNAYQNAHLNCSKIPLTKEEYELVCRWFYDF